MILVTGGTGLVGSHLILELVNKGHSVRALRRPDSQISLIQRLFQIHSDKAEDLFNRIQWTMGDMLDNESLDEAMDGVGDVYHCSAMVSYNPRKGREMIMNNMQGTANVVNMALKKNTRKLCHVSSVASLSLNASQSVITEESSWKSTRHHPPYAISKVESEREIWRGIAEGLNAIIVNPSLIIGYGDPKRDSGRLIRSLSKTSRYYTPGITGMVGVNDVVRAMILLMESAISGERFILNAENVSFRQLTGWVAASFHRRKPSIRIPAVALEAFWRVEHLRSLTTGNEPFITKATARNACKKNYFGGEKITKSLPFEYTPIQKVVRNTCALITSYPF